MRGSLCSVHDGGRRGDPKLYLSTATDRSDTARSIRKGFYITARIVTHEFIDLIKIVIDHYDHS